MWQRIGFTRFASEYWLLAKLIVERITNQARRGQDGLMTNANLTTTRDREESPTSILDKYDETSMQQVNDLIADFQRVAL